MTESETKRLGKLGYAGCVARSSGFLRMLSDRTHGAAQVGEHRAIQVQGHRGCVARGRASLKLQENGAPGEVMRPPLAGGSVTPYLTAVDN